MTYGDGGDADKRVLSAVFTSWLDALERLYDGDADALYTAWAKRTLDVVDKRATLTVSSLPTRAFISTMSRANKGIDHPMKAKSTLVSKVKRELGLREENNNGTDND